MHVLVEDYIDCRASVPAVVGRLVRVLVLHDLPRQVWRNEPVRHRQPGSVQQRLQQLTSESRPLPQLHPVSRVKHIGVALGVDAVAPHEV